ncbi:MAG: hypothetical protein ACRDPY_39685 [Streptosporangiaceae bacterium]
MQDLAVLPAVRPARNREAANPSAVTPATAMNSCGWVNKSALLAQRDRQAHRNWLKLLPAD